MHVQIVSSPQAQADELDRARARVRALEAQLRELGVEPTAEAAYAQTEAAPARDFTHGNTHVSIRAPGTVAGAPQGPIAAAAKTQAGPPRQVKGKPAPAATEPAKKVEIADDASIRAALIEID